MSALTELWNKITVRYGSNYFFALPSDSLVVWVFFGFFLSVILLAIGYSLYLGVKGKKLRPYSDYSKLILWPNFSFGVTGLFLTFCRYEQVAVLSFRFWVYLLLAATTAYNVWLFVSRRQKLHDELERLSEKARKDKWIKQKKKKH